MGIPLLERAAAHGDSIAVVDQSGAHSYAAILSSAYAVASRLLGESGDLEEARVAFMAPPGHRYVAALWGIWLSGGVAVPLCAAHPPPEIDHVLGDSGSRVALLDRSRWSRAPQSATLQRVSLQEALGSAVRAVPDAPQSRRAMLLYTSGATGRPKGVVSTHANITAMVAPLIKAWGWRADDRILHGLAAASCPRDRQRAAVLPLERRRL